MGFGGFFGALGFLPPYYIKFEIYYEKAKIARIYNPL
jgi:hypothetical protein